MTQCKFCVARIYGVVNPRTGRIFWVDTFTGRVHCPASPLPAVPLHHLPNAT